MSLILNLTFRIFGGELWVLRMPTYLAGLLMIPASYVLGKNLYSSSTGMLSAVAVAVFPELIQFSSVFRGYIIVALLTLLGLILGDKLRREKNRFGWAVLIILFTLGLYTIPTMLFPFTILYYWLLFSVFVNDFGSSYESKQDFLSYWFSSGILTGLATFVLYSPILLFSRNDLFNHHWLIPVPWDVLPNRMWGKFLNTWAEWTAPIPELLVWLGIVGIIISFIFHRKFAKHKIPLHIVFVVGISTMILIQRPNAWPRVWSFTIAPILVWVAAGIIFPLSNFKIRAWFLDWIVIGIAFIILLWGAAQHIPNLSTYPVEKSKAEMTASYLQTELHENDMILMDGSYAPFLEYQMLIQGDFSKNFIRDYNFERVLLIVVTKNGESLDTVWKKFGEKYKLDFSTLKILRYFGNYEVYEVFPLQ
ncbi:MAG: glycosyltransferase family 39 protein [Anaerolineales bacterium]|uniref:Glycosyltransferase family 39 protein n=1 Tax=Candidatus Desulfolinea nitratireducens TaxID=2841698 RepID=A0A8J6TH65_9CHLR|nr:glycosyltransferase family 39 protein [Candidatus Desulfolinea nitratireducens]